MLWSQKHITEQMPDIRLGGFRIFMRPAQKKDWPHWAEVRRRNQEYLQPFEPRWAENCLSEDFFERRLARQGRDWQSGHANSFLIFKKEDRLIGGMNINHICRGAAQYASLGYWLDEEMQGQGYMAEALRLTLRYCFEDLELHRVHAACLLHNERSKKLLIQAGFFEEGQARRYLKINGAWQDHVLYGLTAEDWKSAQEA